MRLTNWSRSRSACARTDHTFRGGPPHRRSHWERQVVAPLAETGVPPTAMSPKTIAEINTLTESRSAWAQRVLSLTRSRRVEAARSGDPAARERARSAVSAVFRYARWVIRR